MYEPDLTEHDIRTKSFLHACEGALSAKWANLHRRSLCFIDLYLPSRPQRSTMKPTNPCGAAPHYSRELYRALLAIVECGEAKKERPYGRSRQASHGHRQRRIMPTVARGKIALVGLTDP